MPRSLLEFFRSVGDQLVRSDKFCEQVRQAASAVGDVGKFFKDGNVEARIDPFRTRSCGETCRIAADDDNLFHQRYCSRTVTQELGSVSP